MRGLGFTSTILHQLNTSFVKYVKYFKLLLSHGKKVKKLKCIQHTFYFLSSEIKAIESCLWLNKVKPLCKRKCHKFLCDVKLNAKLHGLTSVWFHIQFSWHYLVMHLSRGHNIIWAHTSLLVCGLNADHLEQRMQSACGYTHWTRRLCKYREYFNYAGRMWYLYFLFLLKENFVHSIFRKCLYYPKSR